MTRRPGSCTTRSASETEEVFIREEPVEAGVSLTSLAHETRKSDDVLLSSHDTLLVDLETRHNVNTHCARSTGHRTAPMWAILTSAISICTEPWSLAVMSLLEAEHFLGM